MAMLPLISLQRPGRSRSPSGKSLVKGWAWTWRGPSFSGRAWPPPDWAGIKVDKCSEKGIQFVMKKTKGKGSKAGVDSPTGFKKKAFKKGDSLKYLITLQNQTSSGKAKCVLVKVSYSSKIRVVATNYLFSSEFLSVCVYIPWSLWWGDTLRGEWGWAETSLPVTKVCEY